MERTSMRQVGGVNRRVWLRQALLAGACLSCAGAETPVKSPPLTVPTIDGKKIEVHNQPGKVVLVDIMTTGCPSCKMAAEAIQVLYRELAGKGFLPVGVAIDPQAPQMLPFYRNLHGLTFPVGIVAREEALRFLNHPADKPLYVPTLALLDKRGRVAMKKVGWTTTEEFRSVITKLLSQKE